MAETMAEVIHARHCLERVHNEDCMFWQEDHESADALSAAGFGLVADAKAEALEEAADTIAAQRDETNPGRSPEEAWSVVDHRDGRFLGKTVAIRWLRARAAALRGDS